MYTKHSTLLHSDIPEADRVRNILAGLWRILLISTSNKTQPVRQISYSCDDRPVS